MAEDNDSSTHSLVAHLGKGRMIRDPVPGQRFEGHCAGEAQAASEVEFTAAPVGLWPLRLLATAAVVALLPVVKPVLLPIVLAVLLALVLAGPVARLHRAGMPEPVGAALVVGLLLCVLGALLIGLADPASIWLERAPASSADLARLLERLREAAPLVHAAAVGSTPAPGAEAAAINEKLASEGVSLTRLVLGQATGFALGAASTVILLYFLLASENWLLVRLMQHARSRRARLRGLTLARCAQHDVAHFLVTMSLLNVVLGVATAGALWLLGLPNPVLWGALAATLNFVPYLGPLALMALLLMAGVATFDSFAMMVAPPLLSLVLNALVTYLLSPLVIGRRLDLNPIGLFLSVMFWGWAWGIAGTLVAVPMLLAARQACRSTRSLRPLSTWLQRPVHSGKTIQALVRADSSWWRRRRIVKAAALQPPARQASDPSAEQYGRQPDIRNQSPPNILADRSADDADRPVSAL